MQFTTLFTKEPEWWYTVEVIELPGCISFWETLDEAKTMIQEAVQAYIESLKKHKEEIPAKRETFIPSFAYDATVQTSRNNKVLA